MYIAETHSTNTLLKERYMDEDNLFTIRTDFQTAGRGQQGNGWESERGKNLLFSILLQQPDIPVSRSFFITMAVTTAMTDAINSLGYAFSSPLTIKWPNDIYIGDKKLAGILIETVLSGSRIAQAVIGIGVNLNQTKWMGAAPNPTSLFLEAGHKTDPQVLLDHFIHYLPQRLQVEEKTCRDYRCRLYRRDGFHWYAPRTVSLQPTMNVMFREESSFEAEIKDITPSGELVLRRRDGVLQVFHFKQIRYVLGEKMP